jgi:hypothetical protein
MAQAPQDLKHHARFDPLFHFFAFPVVLLNVFASIYYCARHFRPLTVWLVVVAAAFAVAVLKTRLYALRNQDRIIRLEERVRMMTLLPEPLRARIGELTVPQCIGLRFACDAELPALVERALRENLDRKQIKQAVQSWRPDHARV